METVKGETTFVFKTTKKNPIEFDDKKSVQVV